MLLTMFSSWSNFRLIRIERIAVRIVHTKGNGNGWADVDSRGPAVFLSWGKSCREDCGSEPYGGYAGAMPIATPVLFRLQGLVQGDLISLVYVDDTMDRLITGRANVNDIVAGTEQELNR